MEGTAGAGATPVATKFGGSTPLNLKSDFVIPGGKKESDGGGDGGAGDGAGNGGGSGAGDGNNGQNSNQQQSAGGNSGNNAGGDAGSGAGAGAGDGGSGSTDVISEEKVISALKAAGIDVKNLEEIKTKMTAPVELNDEQKKQLQAEKDNKLLQLYIAGGGTPEQYVAMKSLLTANPKEIASGKIRAELKEAGFENDEIDVLLAERYYQQDPEKLERTTDESEEDFKKRKDALAKKVAFGNNRIESRGKSLIQNAQTFFAGLEEALSIQEQLSKRESDFAAKVDEAASKIERKVTIQLGKVNVGGKDIDIPPIAVDVTDEDIAEVTGTLKDQSKRNQFFNKDNGLNLENVLPLMLRNKYLEQAVQKGFLGGNDVAVAEFRKVFPGASAQDVGLGGGNNGSNASNGKVAKAGKSTPMPVQMK